MPKKTEQNLEETTGVVDNGDKSDAVGKIVTNSAIEGEGEIEGGEIETQPTENIRLKGNKSRKEASERESVLLNSGNVRVCRFSCKKTILRTMSMIEKMID